MHTKNDVNLLVDYLTFTLGFDCLVESVDNPEEEDETEKGVLETLCLILGIGDLEFARRHGFNGYDLAYAREGITLCWGGCDTIMVQMSGMGCRLYESLAHSLEWMELILLVQSFPRHNFSRLDIACDTFGVLSMSKLMQYTLSQRYVARFNDYFVGQGNKEESILFGSPASRMRLRIYNKTLERIHELGSAEDVPPDWVRLEFQLRDAAADSFISSWQATGNISTTYFGIMTNQLRYVKQRDPENVSRSVLVSWWGRFLGNADKIPMAYRGGLEYNLQSLQRYVFGQAGSSIRAWLEVNENNHARLADLVQYKKLNERQKNLIELMTEFPK